VDFSEARDLFVNIFRISDRTEKIVDRGLILEKQRGFFAKSAKLDRGLILEKQRGFFAKYPGIFRPGIIFQRINPWTDRVCSVHRGLTPARTEGTAARSPELGLRPLRCAKTRRRGRKMDRGSLGARLGPHRSLGVAAEARRRWCRIGRRRHSVRTLLRRGEREKEAGKGVVSLGGVARLL
jgi:hypothetical protein